MKQPRRPVRKKSPADLSLEKGRDRARQKIEAHLNNSPLAVIEFDPEFRVIAWSGEAERLFGWPAGEIIGRAIAEMKWVHEEDVEKVKKISEDMLLRRSPRNMHANRNYRSDGSVVHCEWYNSAIYDESGRLESILSFVLDVTERKRLDDELRGALQRLYFHIENTPLGVLVFNKEFRISHWSKQAEKIFGWDASEIVGLRFDEVRLVYDEDLQQVSDLIADMLSSRRTSIVTTNRNYRKDGSVVTCEWYSSALMDHAGELTSVLSLVLDITSRQAAELELKESRQRLQSVLENSLDVIYQRNLQKNRYDFISQAIKDITGWSVEEFSNAALESVIELIHPDDFPQVKKELGRAIDECRKSGRGSCAVEYRLKKKNGEYCWFADSIVVLPDGRGEPLYLQGVVRDITERKRLDRQQREFEQYLARSDKLEAIGTLAAGIAHDFNNMLTSMFGFVELSLRLAKGANQEKIAQYLSAAISSFEKARDLTGQLLTFSKGGAPRKRTLNLSDFVRKRGLSSLIDSNITPVLDIEEEISCDFDEIQLARALDNIVANAREAMPGGGRIEFSVKKVAAANVPGPYPRKDYVMVAVRDHGPGIEKEHLGKIFDPFFSTREARSGLGLATSYSIVRQHGGFITAASETGAGATISIFLPVTIDPALKEKLPETGRRRAGRILIMDDESYILEMLTIILQDLGYDVSPAENGEKALALAGEAVAQGNPFQCAILDLTIPGGRGGREVIGELMKIDPGIKAVASSGYSNDPVMVRPADFGFYGKLEKPYLRDDLVRVIDSISGGPGTR